MASVLAQLALQHLPRAAQAEAQNAYLTSIRYTLPTRLALTSKRHGFTRLGRPCTHAHAHAPPGSFAVLGCARALYKLTSGLHWLGHGYVMSAQRFIPRFATFLLPPPILSTPDNRIAHGLRSRPSHLLSPPSSTV
ncbi:hypothetical protein EW146_g541 [Bondarzewia mesenterica]|uniref:Uncharacterized protein n=1 Tax=Bondarzewia mesenterica TaxID=1095465 RepID=A0A4S4M6I9_9AGAM|nr:hypothetical protein EW146_g541 [Bondarzewia mesenterica]